MGTGVKTETNGKAAPTCWYLVSTLIAMLIVLIYVVFTFVVPVIPIAPIAGSMAELVPYYVPVIGGVAWLVALAVRLFVHKNKKQIVWVETAFRYGIIAFGGAGLLVILVASGTSGYIRKTEQFRRQMQRQADIPAIREWAEATLFSAESSASSDGKTRRIMTYRGEKPECMKNISGFFSIRYDTENKTVHLIHGGGFGHWGLTVGPKGTKPYGGHTLPLEDGAWVWHEIQ